MIIKDEKREEHNTFKGISYSVDNKNCGFISKWYNFKTAIITEPRIPAVNPKLYKS